MKSKIAILLYAFASVLLPTNNTWASSCRRWAPCEAFGYASAVFVGRVIEGTENARVSPNLGGTVSYEFGRVRFAVEESFKGVDTTEITVHVQDPREPGSLVPALRCGERYLVYARSSDSEGLSIGHCSPTKPLDDSDTDLEFLRNLPLPGVGGRLYGKVAVETNDSMLIPLAGITIIVEDETGRILQVKTDSDGNYELTGLESGTYTATPVLPENYVPKSKRHESREVIVFDRGCSFAPFWVSAK